MITPPKCCKTCKRLQPDNNYCHRLKQTRYNVLGDVKCDYYAKAWGNRYVDKISAINNPVRKISFLDAINMGVT